MRTHADVRELSILLVDAVRREDVLGAKALVAQGADPFLACAPVDVFVLGSGWEMKLGNGCAAAQAIRLPHMLDAILPKRMDELPVVTRATSVWGSVCKEGQDVCLGQWAVEAEAPLSLAVLICRMDRQRRSAERDLARLALACMDGCHGAQRNDVVYPCLLMLMACKVELDAFAGGWDRLDGLRLIESFNNLREVRVPFAFSLAQASSDGIEPAHHALRWVLQRSAQQKKFRLADPEGWTLLHWAVHQGHQDLVQIALDGGVDPLVADAAGLTASALAVATGKKECAALIEAWRSRLILEQIRLSQPSPERNHHVNERQTNPLFGNENEISFPLEAP